MERITREKVFIKKLGKELVLDFFTINDDNWMMDTFGEANIQKALSEFEPEIILAIFWRILDDSSKRIISKVDVIKWEGMKEVKLDIDEPVEKLKNIISGADELMKIWMAIIETKRKSMPSIEENAKKKVTAESL